MTKKTRETREIVLTDEQNAIVDQFIRLRNDLGLDFELLGPSLEKVQKRYVRLVGRGQTAEAKEHRAERRVGILAERAEKKQLKAEAKALRTSERIAKLKARQEKIAARLLKLGN